MLSAKLDYLENTIYKISLAMYQRPKILYNLINVLTII